MAFAESLQSSQCSAAAGAIVLAYYLIPYLQDPYNYRRRFSGPWLASFTNWWMSNAVKKGNHSEIVRELHEKYGTFVRLGPNHISIADPAAHEAVYGHGSKLLKSEFYKAFENGKTDVFNTQDRAEHSMKRKRIANIFSQQNVLAFEPRVRRQIQELCDEWDKRCDESAQGISGFNWEEKNGRAVLDCCAQFSYLAFDIIAGLALGFPFGMVRAQKDTAPIVRSSTTPENDLAKSNQLPMINTVTRGGRFIRATGVYPSWVHKIALFLPWNIPILFERLNIFKLTGSSVEARLRRDSEAPEKTTADLIDKLLAVRNPDGLPLSKIELYAEALLLLIAGSDTTSNTLGAAAYYLAMHPEAQRKLQEELDLHAPFDTSEDMELKNDLSVSSSVVRFEQVKGLPYLNACVKETLRLHSTVGTGLPRVVPPGKTLTIRGETFKAGSIISVPSFTTNRSGVWGSDAEQFRPERWLEDNADSLNKYFVPYSVGPRACVGRNLANMDLLLIVATVFRRYDVELADPTAKLLVSEGFVREASNCKIAIKKRN